MNFIRIQESVLYAQLLMQFREKAHDRVVCRASSPRFANPTFIKPEKSFSIHLEISIKLTIKEKKKTGKGKRKFSPL